MPSPSSFCLCHAYLDTMYGPGTGSKVFGGAILDLEDFLVSNILLRSGFSCIPAFLCFKRGWGWGKLHRRSQHRKRHEDPKWMRGYITYILPLIILFYLLLWSVR